MNGADVQARVYAGMAKAAAHAGVPYSVYRAESPINPIEAGNLLGEVNCFFAAEKRFEVPHKFKEPTRYLYADGRELLPRDILVGPYGTFFVGDQQPLLPMQVIRCNDSIKVERTFYVGTTLASDVIAVAVPCFRQLKKVDQKPVGGAFGASNSATPIGEWFCYVPIDWTLLHQGDIVTDSTDRTYDISVIDPTEIGAVLVIRQTDTSTEVT